MKEVELLDALSKGFGGIQINMTANSVTVITRYCPRIIKSAPTLLEAAMKVGTAILEYQEMFVNAPAPPGIVLEALYAYHGRTGLLEMT